MAIQGVQKLPVYIKLNEAVNLLEKIALVERKIGKLDEKFNNFSIHLDFFDSLSLQESVQSTRIEETQVTYTEIVEQTNNENPRWEVVEVRNYKRALDRGIESIRKGSPLSSNLIKELHHILFTGEARGSKGNTGEFRKIQNYIGPTKKKEDAVYIPVAANVINDYMKNWEYFVNGDPYKEFKEDHQNKSEDIYVIDQDAHPLFKAAIMHAQFESIHPFLDGNGRIGRILIPLYMVQANLVSSPIFFISEELEKYRTKYYSLLNKVRGSSPEWGKWLNFFIEATDRMTDNLSNVIKEAEKLAHIGKEKCTTPNEENVYLLTFKHPNITAKKVTEHLGISMSTARRVLNKLSDLELLYKDDTKKRNIEYLNYDVQDILRRQS